MELGYEEPVIDTIMSSMHGSTNKVYNNHIVRWIKFCNQHDMDHKHTTTQFVSKFLQHLFDEGLGYSSISTTKSAVASCIIMPYDQQLTDNREVGSFMKGVLNKRPPTVRHKELWDSDIVLRWMESRGSPTQEITAMLAKRLSMLILLVSGQRPQVLVALRLSDLSFGENIAKFDLTNADVKQGRRGYKPPPPHHFERIHPSQNICVLSHLKTYMDRTTIARQNVDNLFVTGVKVARPVTLNTLSRWVKEVMTMSGVDTERYAAGSARSASTSKAAKLGMTIDDIVRTVGWAKQSTFA